MPETSPIPDAPAPFVPFETLDAFRESVTLRDPRGRSARPGLRPGEQDGRAGIFLGDRFNLFFDYEVRASHGRRFVDSTGDDNPIHREGNIVPGAMTVSKVLLPLEVLVPSFQPRRLRMQFKQPSFYGAASRAMFAWERDGDDVHVQARVFQRGEIVARCQLRGEVDGGLEKKRSPLFRSAGLDRVRSYFHAMRIDARAYLEPQGRPFYFYPHAFIASLPSGEMVRHLDGEGGILNSLRLDFGASSRIPIAKDPQVKLEPGRLKTTFRKVMTSIVEGLETYCQGFALVNPPTPASSTPEE